MKTMDYIMLAPIFYTLMGLGTMVWLLTYQIWKGIDE